MLQVFWEFVFGCFLFGCCVWFGCFVLTTPLNMWSLPAWSSNSEKFKRASLGIYCLWGTEYYWWGLRWWVPESLASEPWEVPLSWAVLRESLFEDSLPHLYTGLEANHPSCKETLLKFLISCPFMGRERECVKESEKEVRAKHIERV